MMFPTQMLQLVAVVLGPDVEPVTKTLLDAGVVDFIDTREIAAQARVNLSGVGEQASVRRITELRSRIETMLGEISVSPATEAALDISKLDRIDLDATRARIDDLAAKIGREQEKRRDAEQEVLRLRDMRKQLALFGNLQAGIKSSTRFSYLNIETGCVETSRYEQLQEALGDYPSVAIETRRDEEHTYLLVISLKRDEQEIDRLLDRFGWSDVDISDEVDELGDEVSVGIDERISQAEQAEKEASEQIRSLVADDSSELQEMWEQLKLNELYARVQSNFSKTRKTVLVSGWLPQHHRDAVDRRIRDACNEGCYIEWRSPSTEQLERTPVELNNPRFLQPFELLVRNYSTPAYGTIDPTPLVAISYLAMFGLMFGDAGHGLFLALCGVVGRLLYRKKGAARQLLTLLIWCGGAAVVTGVLFGSYFGMQWLPPLWFDYHGIVSGHGGGELVGSIYDVLAITVYFGVAIIALGLLLNWVNLVLRKHWFELVFDKAGLLGGIIYFAGFAAAVHFVRHDYRQLPDPLFLGLFIGLPVVALALKAPLHYLSQRKRGEAEPLHPLSFVDFAMEWIVEILEVFSGYLANTLSFMRVAGLGIAHEALMIAFFSIARMTGGGDINFVSVLVLILGNLLVILLEGLSAGIQSLRLNYYEFFSKYFTGAGRAYDPVSLRTEGLKESP